MKPKLSARDRRSGKGCWYYFETHECPLCGAGGTFKVRMEGPKPKKPENRYGHIGVTCSEHFL